MCWVVQSLVDACSTLHKPYGYLLPKAWGRAIPAHTGSLRNALRPTLRGLQRACPSPLHRAVRPECHRGGKPGTGASVSGLEIADPVMLAEVRTWISLTATLRESSFFRSENPEPRHEYKTQNRSQQEKAFHDGALKQSGQRQNQDSHSWQEH